MKDAPPPYIPAGRHFRRPCVHSPLLASTYAVHDAYMDAYTKRTRARVRIDPYTKRCVHGCVHGLTPRH